MATSVSKKIECRKIPATFNQIYIHNPKNIDADNIKIHLMHEFKGVFEVSYNMRKKEWIGQNNSIDETNRIELLTVHSYDALILEKHHSRSMKEVRIINLQQKNLHCLNDYLEVLQTLIKIENIAKYLQNNIIPIVADWPGQLFIRKTITKIIQLEQQQNFNNEYKIIKNFVPLIGPLHVSLNSREHVIKLYWDLFNELFHHVFGPRKVLAKKPKPWRINLLLDLASGGWKKISHVILNKFPKNCKDIEYRMMIDLLDNIIPSTLDVYAVLFRSGSFEEYLETIFRIWTFALRWKRKNYNKAPLAFLSDYYYWKDNGHPFNETIRSYLVNFNDYYVENIHSKIRNNTTSLSTPEAIINEAYLLDLHDQTTINMFKNERTYPYTEPMLDELTTRTSLFLLNHFRSIYLNLGKSKLENPQKKTYMLVTLDKIVDSRFLPAGYNTMYPPSINLCDHCKGLLETPNNNEVVLICGHGYHASCYNELEKQCKYCEEYYIKGINDNATKFVKRLEEGPEILTNDDFDEVEVEEEEDNDDVNVPVNSLNVDFDRELNLVNDW